MQNDSIKWVSIIEFLDNNDVLASIEITLFYFNKHGHMN